MAIMGLLLGMCVLILVVFKKNNLVLASLLCITICGLSNHMTLWETFHIFAGGVGDYLGKIMFVFIFASIYGQVFSDTGCASSIAYLIIRLFGKSKYSLLTIPILTALLVYGGISVFVVVFTVMPIGVMLLKETNLNKSLLPGLINFGATTFAMTCLPGTPQLNNLIPSAILNTPTTAAPLLGGIGAVSMIIMGCLYYRHQIARYEQAGMVFDETKARPEQLHTRKVEDCPPPWKAFLSLGCMLAIYLACANGLFGAKMPTFDAVNTGMIAATALMFLLFSREYHISAAALIKGSATWITPLIHLCLVIGVGTVVKNTMGYQEVLQLVLRIPGNVYIGAATSTTLIAGITGSASGGIQIAMESMAEGWLARGGQAEILHRICAIASGGLDSLPHAGGLFTVFAVCNETHKSGYKHIFYSTVVIPLAATAILLICIQLGIA